MDNKLCAVIMCGGSGTRFWPASRRDKPKQFLRLNNQTSLIEDTVTRLEGLIPPERVFLLAGESHAPELKRQLPEVPLENYILEPDARNTGPALALAARKLEAVSKDLVMVALPADHAIKDVKGFRRTLKRAGDFAEESSHIVTIGITPDTPETGYGYIKMGKELANSVRDVEAFVEKPHLAKAQEYVESGQYVWNGGIFVTRVSVLIDAIKEYEPGLYKALWQKVPAPGDAGHDSILRDVYPNLTRISIDCAVMERAEKVACVPAIFDWNDLGSWSALEKYWGRDKQGNAVAGRYYSVDSSGNIISATGRDIAIIGVDDLVIVERDDVLLVCAKDRCQDVKMLIEMFEKEGRDDLL